MRKMETRNTHTFHLPIGECTITLEDVHMLLDSCVNSFAVNGKINVAYSKAQDLLGIELTDTTRKCQFIEMK